VAGKADVHAHLNNRRESIQGLFRDWSDLAASAADRAEMIERYFKESDCGEIRRIGSGNTIHVRSSARSQQRVKVLVVGRHDVNDLGSATRGTSSAGSSIGPGLASRLGPTVAFSEGFQAARELTVEDPVNIEFLSLGPGDTYADIATAVFTGNVDAVYLTNAVVWSPGHPTLTTGSRGQLVAELTLSAGAPINDFAVSGATRNPLTKMTQLLGELRDPRGRIALPGFYERARAPDAAIRQALSADGHDPNAWAQALNIATPGGGLSSLERASLWPGVSVLSITSDVNDGATAPGTVTATVAIYLVPDQRHVEIERSLRSWFQANAPADLHPSMKLTASSRPFRAAADSLAVQAQARATFRLYGRQPVLVPAGGPAGAGETAFALGCPIGFAGIARPSSTTGTVAEALPWAEFDSGVALAAETSLQLRRV